MRNQPRFVKRIGKFRARPSASPLFRFHPAKGTLGTLGTCSRKWGAKWGAKRRRLLEEHVRHGRTSGAVTLTGKSYVSGRRQKKTRIKTEKNKKRQENTRTTGKTQKTTGKTQKTKGGRQKTKGKSNSPINSRKRTGDGP